MKDKIFGILQRVGRSFMLPIAILPVAGLLLGLGQSLTNADFLKTYGLNGVMGEGTVPYAIFTVMGDAGNIIFGNLPLIFAIGVAIGMAKKETLKPFIRSWEGDYACVAGDKGKEKLANIKNLESMKIFL